jgi:hypothetical protein
MNCLCAKQRRYDILQVLRTVLFKLIACKLLCRAAAPPFKKERGRGELVKGNVITFCLNSIRIIFGQPLSSWYAFRWPNLETCDFRTQSNTPIAQMKNSSTFRTG